MKISGINLIERHIEKVLIFIGALFAVWLLYKNFVQEPNTIPLPNQPFVTVQPGQVGENITKAVEDLREKIKEAEENPPVFKPVPDYLSQVTSAENDPLSDLVNMPNIVFAPLNAPLENAPLSPTVRWAYVVPVVPPLTQVAVNQGRGVAMLPPAAGNQGQGQPAPAPAQTLDVVWVQLTAEFPMTQWLSSLAAKDHPLQQNQQPLPASYQRTTFYRVDVQRRQLLPNGQWSSWQNVDGTYINPLPQIDLTTIQVSDFSSVLDGLDSQAGNILDPAFYTIEQTARHTPSPATQPAAPSPGPMPPSNNFGGRGGPSGQPMPQPEVQGAPPSFGPAPQSPPGSNSLTSQPQVPVTFYDASVTPGTSYQYRMRIELYNPVYQFPYNLTDPAAKSVQWLTSLWSEPSAVIHVSNNLYFYVLGGQVAQGQAGIRIFKWIHGTWAVGDEDVRIGEPIGDTESVTMIDPATGSLTPQTVDFDTGFQLVNVIAVPSNDSVTIVISGPDGGLGLRNSAWDATDPDQQKLISSMQSGGTPTDSGQ